nr:hypothetical protein [Tanacetum cinerariifolium]
SSSYDDDFCADVTNLDSNVTVDPVATMRINSIHPQSHILGDLQSPEQTRKPSSVANTLVDPDWVAAMQEEMQQFYHQQVWKLIPLPAGKIAIGTKWILKNKRDARGIVVYVDDIIFGSTNKAWCDEFEVLMKGEFEMSAMGELTFFLGLQVKQLPNEIFISQDKYVKDMLKKFDMESVRADDLVSIGGCTLPAGSYSFLLLDWFLLVVLFVHADEFVSAGGCSLPAGSYSFLLLDWFLLVVVLPVREHSPVREPTPVREPSPHPKPKPTPDSPIPLSPPPSSVAVGPTISSGPPSPSRHPSGPDDIREGGGDFASSLPSNEAPQTLAATVAGRAEDSAALTALTLKLDECLHRVATLENELGITKKVLGGAVLKLVTRVKRLEGLLQKRKRRLVLSDSKGEDATTTEQEFDLAPQEAVYFFFSAHVSETIPPGVRVPAAATTIPADSLMDAAVHAAAAPSFSIPTAADKGKALMVDNSPHADLLSEHERVLKNLHDSQLGEELAKKIQAEQEAEFARQQEELAQKAQAESVASPTAHGQEMSDQRRRELDAAQLIYTEANWLDLLAKIATNSALSKQLLGDDITEENMNERLGMLLMPKRRERAEQSRVKPMTKTQQRDYMRDFMKNCSASVHSTFRPKPTLDAPPAKRANQAAPQVPAISTQDPAGVLVAPLIPDDASLLAASSSDPAAVSVPAEPMVHSAESHMDDPLTAPEHGSSEPTEMVPSHLGSVHAYHNMTGHTKHFTTLREILHMVERIDLQRLLGAVDALYQSEEPDTFSLLLWGDLHMLFQSLDDTDALHFWRTQDSWRIRSWRLYPQAQVYVLEMV